LNFKSVFLRLNISNLFEIDLVVNVGYLHILLLLLYYSNNKFLVYLHDIIEYFSHIFIYKLCEEHRIYFIIIDYIKNIINYYWKHLPLNQKVLPINPKVTISWNSRK